MTKKVITINETGTISKPADILVVLLSFLTVSQKFTEFIIRLTVIMILIHSYALN